MVTLHPIDADDGDALAAYLHVSEAAREADTPWVPPMTPFRTEMWVRHGWEGEPAQFYVVREGEAVVGCCWLKTFTWDNPDLAWLRVVIAPGHRRRGYGSAVMGMLLEECRRLGRTLIGIDHWEDEGIARFAAALGFEPKSWSVAMRQSLRELPVGLLDEAHAEAAPFVGDYELVRLQGRIPDELIEELAVVAATISDAPKDELELDDDVYVPERIRAYERAHQASRLRAMRVLARHRPSGALAGHTVVVVDDESPAYAEQEDTAVARGHRGHRLGLLLKAEMCRWLLEAEPEVQHIDTWNAESNTHMRAVNRRLGYQVIGRSVEYQRRI